MDPVDLEALNAFRSARTVSPRTWTKELGTVRHCFRFCHDNEWILRNRAEKVQMPKNLKPAERGPYQPVEAAKIIAACDVIGCGPYETGNLVDLVRFELTTSSMPWKRAPNCATGPRGYSPTL